jgi:tetratricopeptide (TPR) repeat protein
LTDRERGDFENELKSNHELYQAFQLHDRMYSALQHEDDNELRDMLEEIHQKVASRRQYLIWFKYAAAAVLLLLIASALFFILSSNQHYSNDKLFSMYYKAYETPGDIRSAIGQNDRNLTLGMQLYDENNYDRAYAQFSQLIKTDSANAVALFYAGTSLMALNRFTEAVPFFKAVVANQDVLLTDQSKWYLALVCLKTGDNRDAENILLDLEKTSHYYRNDAKEILNKMSKN